MRRTYHQLTIEERCEMGRLQADGYCQRQIAASLDRSPSTISRELRRNCSRTGGYKPTYANQQARARRWSGSKLDRDAGLLRQALSCLMRGWSPEQVSGRLALEAGSRADSSMRTCLFSVSSGIVEKTSRSSSALSAVYH